MIKIRKTLDIESVKKIHSMCLPQDEWYEHEKNIYWLGSHNGKSICFGMATEYGRGILFLSRCGVITSYRGRGIHKKLISIRLAHARKAGIRTVITYTEMENYASSNNLIHYGFKLYDPECAYVGEGFLYWMLQI